MQLTDDEIREILIREKRRKKKRQRVKRRITLLILGVLILVLGVGIFINRNAMVKPRGIIFIDAGHGGVDGGSVVGDRLEKNDTLRLSLAVRDELKDLGFKVYMSRTGDDDVDRAERGNMANRKKANLMISIHRNKAEEGSGVEVYIPKTDDPESRLLGESLMKALVGQGFVEREVRAGTLVSSDDDYAENAVPTMPSCLIEVGFLQDKGDNKLFDEKLEENARVMAEAISETFRQLYEPEETASDEEL